MWRRRVLSEVFTFMGSCRNKKSQFIGASSSVRACSCPALPVHRITALQAVNSWSQHFQEKGVSEPDLSSRYITAHVLGAKTIEGIKAETLSRLLSPEKTQQIWKLCAKRLTGMPLQYVIEEWDFRDLTLKMRPPVFIPRPETEELVEFVLSDLKEKTGSLSILEVGCGSGAISLSLLKSLPWLRALVFDQSEDAITLTKTMLQLYHLDILKEEEAILSLCNGVQALVSNPPYLYTEDMASLQPEVLRYEDPAALDGGTDGLVVIRQVLNLASKVLQNHGRVYLEVDPRHPPLIQQWAESHREEMHYVETKLDFNNRPRFCILQKAETNKDRKQDLD
ncbi:hypothetical protein WMY93_011666 [Mugilogobius chulae]|uniref:peptide chain release factor N(5)-glutamine methyltransferase n=1 Tax=Mugilogobius chulae TaxID=88201 RepID=A0AAW0P3B6_9GOBI